MSGIVLDHFDGYLRMIFHPAEYGMLPFDLALYGDMTARTSCDDQFVKGEPVIHAQADATVRMHVSSALDGFPCILAWLEAVTCGVQECACDWDGEGPDGYLRWTVASGESGTLKVTWTEGRQKQRVRLNKAQMVRAFYESFRDFVESDRYDPLCYEKLSAGETFALVLEGGDLDALADHLAMLPRDRAESFMEVMLDLAGNHDAGYPRRASLAEFKERAVQREIDLPEEHRRVAVEWDCWDFTQRRQDVVEKIYKRWTWIGDGGKLRELRSPLVEGWLADQAQAGPQGSGERA